MKILTLFLFLLSLSGMTHAESIPDITTLWNITIDSRYPPKVYFIYTDVNGDKMCQWVDLSKPIKPMRTNGVFFMMNHYAGENTQEDWDVCYPNKEP